MKTVQELLTTLVEPEQLTLSAKELVISHYADAKVFPLDQPRWSKKFGIETNDEAWMLGIGDTEDEAWESAGIEVIKKSA